MVVALISILFNSTNIKADEEDYPKAKYQITEFINYYKSIFTDEILDNKNIEKEIKAEIVNVYNLLKEEDQEPYKEFIYRILRGGVPKIIKEKRKLTYQVGENIDLYSFIKAIDNEDKIIISNKDNTKIKTNLNTSLAGIYKVFYILKDSDNNKVKTKIIITIIENDKTQKEVVKNTKEESLNIKVPNTGL